MSFIEKNFLLNTKTSQKLYFDFAKDMPIFDYHCHISEKLILENKPFENIYQIWLSGDHYKWRLMRNYGVDESFITGNKSDKEKFIKYCEVLSTAFGNPLYHWSQLELEKYFGCNLEINLSNANKIWDFCNDFISKNKITPQQLIESSNVKIIFTTNEIFDDVKIFQTINKCNYKFKVFPAFRADKIMNIESDLYNDYLSKLGNITSLKELEQAIEKQLKKFIEVGCVASDIALQKIYPIASKKDAEKVLYKKLKKMNLSENDIASFKGYLTYFLLSLYGKYNIRSELHIGAMRNNNQLAFEKLGQDCGYDSIAEDNSTTNLSKLFNKLVCESKMPPVILFNLNPKMNTEIIALMNCFQDSSLKGKIQYGPAWWFLDNKDGIRTNLRDLSNQGHLATFIGMLTDSRSLLSYERHQYFRRILCDYLGNLMEKGEITKDINLVGDVIKNICFTNAIKYFGK